MQAKLRRNFSGTFSAENLGASLWRLSQREARHVELYLRGADHTAAQAFAGRTQHDVGVEWHDGRVLMTLLSHGRVASVTAAGIFAHEPLPELFEALPLERYDGRARRFWGRVFWLVRLPGGRSLLNLLARGGRRGG